MAGRPDKKDDGVLRCDVMFVARVRREKPIRPLLPALGVTGYMKVRDPRKLSPNNVWDFLGQNIKNALKRKGKHDT